MATILARDEGEPSYIIRDELRAEMESNCGVFRDEIGRASCRERG